MRGHRAACVAAVGLGGSSVALVAAGAVLHVLDHAGTAAPITQWWVTNGVSAFGLGLPGALLAARRPRNPIGWILLAVGVGHAVTLASREYAVYAVEHHLAASAWAVWVGTWSWLDIGLLAVVFALFPDASLRGRWSWRLVPVAAAVAAEILVAGGNALYPGSMTGGGPLGRLDNPVGWAAAGRFFDRIGYDAPVYALVGATALGVLAMLAQLRRRDPVIRRQVLLVTPAAVAFVAEVAYEVNGSDRIAAYTAPFIVALIAVSIAAAILRYDLYELDVVVSRSLVYAVLSALLAAAYLVTVALTQAFVGNGFLASLAGAALVAALFAPMRNAVQDVFDGLLFGARRDPYTVFASLGAAASEDDVLPALAGAVARTLKLPYVAVELEGLPPAEVGQLRGEPTTLDIGYGKLVLGPRTPSDPFTRAELRLFDDVARQVGVAARAVLLTREVQQSRERLVSAREEERRRLRRDLHDGLGPSLAGIALQLGSARQLLGTDPAAADALLGQLVTETQGAIADVRRLVYDLRPPALDELGLVRALQQQAQRFPGLDVRVVAEDIDTLPAAVEVAAFRIATEALTNASRHAEATRCVIELTVNGALELRVADDGRGLAPSWRPGVGVTSIRERAAELGGSARFAEGPGGGTVVHAKLPLEPA